MASRDEFETEGSETGSRRSTDDDGEQDAPGEAIAQQESRDVVRLRLAVLLVLVCSAAAVAASIYCYVAASEESQFRERFKGDAHKVLEAVGSSIDQTYGALDSVAVSLVSHADFANETWPFVTLPNFAVKMAKLLKLSNAFTVTVLPIVTPENRAEWEAYSVANDGWVDESTAIQATWDGYYGPIVYGGEKNREIHGDFDVIPANESRIMLPKWQSFPILANTSYTYNYDWLSIPSDGLSLSLDKHVATVTKPFMLQNGDTPDEYLEAWAEVYRMYIGPDEEAMEPVSELIYPIVNDIDRVKVAGADDYDSNGHQIVGALLAEFYWRSLLRNSLPDDSVGIQVVITSCEVPFSYQINGAATEYLGTGDLHDPKYDRLGLHRSIRALNEFASGRSEYSGAKIDDSTCPISLHLYPSDRMKADFLSNDPIIFSVCALLIFALTSLVFYMYDAKVERRQKTVMNKAVRSSAIVSSLFPATVRDQLYEEANVDKSSVFHVSDGYDSPAESEYKGRPIASLYENTTIMFADIVGFTAWSSIRSPVQVFELLETLYQAFDVIAVRRKVFKVETIGDCYVAVAGLPDPQEDHAVIMAKFADDCMTRMSQLTTELTAVLGEDTADLAMRVGLHSGSVTGGVLRGQKSRFQLFGDAMNTASRMESTGMPHRIHASQETAEELTAKGKGAWIARREDKVAAKGKGELQTFWVSVRATTHSIASSPTGPC